MLLKILQEIAKLAKSHFCTHILAGTVEKKEGNYQDRGLEDHFQKMALEGEGPKLRTKSHIHIGGDGTPYTLSLTHTYKH